MPIDLFYLQAGSDKLANGAVAPWSGTISPQWHEEITKHDLSALVSCVQRAQIAVVKEQR